MALNPPHDLIHQLLLYPIRLALQLVVAPLFVPASVRQLGLTQPRIATSDRNGWEVRGQGRRLTHLVQT
jgi:hypothetical protein